MDNLMEKLMASKAVMDKMEGITKGGNRRPSSENVMPEFNIPQAKYNIPQEYLQESSSTQQPYLSSGPVVNTKPFGVPTSEAIKNSKLPEEIKKLMMEHPIQQPEQPTATLSNELIERASRLMKDNTNNLYTPDAAKPKQQTQQPVITNSIDYKLIKEMINEAVGNALKENGLVTESSEKSNEVFNFRVGKHIFEGKITKIKKLS